MLQKLRKLFEALVAITDLAPFGTLALVFLVAHLAGCARRPTSVSQAAKIPVSQGPVEMVVKEYDDHVTNIMEEGRERWYVAQFCDSFGDLVTLRGARPFVTYRSDICREAGKPEAWTPPPSDGFIVCKGVRPKGFVRRIPRVSWSGVPCREEVSRSCPVQAGVRPCRRLPLLLYLTVIYKVCYNESREICSLNSLFVSEVRRGCGAVMRIGLPV